MIKCENCGGLFTKFRKNKFCCDACRIKFISDKKKANNPIIKRQCKICGTDIFTNSNKIFCGNQCRQFSYRAEAKEIRLKNTEIFRNMKFKEYKYIDGDEKDFPMKDLAIYKYCDIKLKDHMKLYGIIPRLAKKEVNTLRGVRRIKINMVNINELIQLYNIKVEKFRNYPHLSVKNTIIDIGNIIDFARRINNEKNIIVSI